MHAVAAHSHQHRRDDEALAVMLDLDGQVLAGHLAELTAWIATAMGESPPARILDLGAGSGSGTFALLERFPAAEVTALDLSTAMLERLSANAAQRGLGGRVHPVLTDLDDPALELPASDLVWASASLHHLADPLRTLRAVFDALRPGGVLVAVEIDAFPRFLPDDIGYGRPGLESRMDAVVSAQRAADMPTLGSDWGARLAAAGFELEEERRFDIDLPASSVADLGRYAEATLRRMRAALGDGLDREDRDALDRLLDGDGPDAIGTRPDLRVMTRRSAWLARRPRTR
ncbi:MAG TPA: class I SAM-dependent methyltransferase [Pseudolysinimonas sp.]|nr:class I SAM-dependent methyltransferase [Pseudolysinimonas sp.]